MKMEIIVKIKNDDGSETIKPVVVDTEVPNYEEFKGPDNFRETFDILEKAALKVRNEAVETAIEKYLAELSKKACEAVTTKERTLTLGDSPYEIEAEVGRINVDTYKVTHGSRTVFNSKGDVFPKKSQTERYHSACYDDLQLRLASSVPSYRESAEILNRVWWRDEEDKIKYRTMSDAVEREGNKIIDCIDEKAKRILEENDFDINTGAPLDVDTVDRDLCNPSVPSISQEKIDQVIDEYNCGREKDLQIDETSIHEAFVSDEHCVNISIDDVGAVEQKESGRMKNPPPKDGRHYVRNTVVHIQQGFMKYVIDGLSIRKVLIVLIAFLLHNGLFENKCLVFFTDGADDIKKAIREVFVWRPYRIIPDWYHLKKKCRERLSMAMRGREIRNEVLTKILQFLWLGKVEKAVEYLKALDNGKIKNKEHIEKLIAYLDRNFSYIPCYALRKKLGLRVSSNRGEKANDLVVAQRQKHNGMSWSKTGSSGLANVNALFLNKENENWINKKTIEFRLCHNDIKDSVA